MTRSGLSQQCLRIIGLRQQLTDAIDDSECSWPEAIGAVGFALALLLDRHDSEAMRVAMAQQVAQRLLSGAVMRGTFGVTETMQ